MGKPKGQIRSIRFEQLSIWMPRRDLSRLLLHAEALFEGGVRRLDPRQLRDDLAKGGGTNVLIETPENMKKKKQDTTNIVFENLEGTNKNKV